MRDSLSISSRRFPGGGPAPSIQFPVSSFLFSPHSAFTLIEVLVTVVILSVGIVGVLSAFNYAVAALDASGETLAADRVIAERLDALRESAAGGGDPAAGRTSGTVSYPSGDYRWDVDLSPLLQLPETQREGAAVREAVYEARVTVRRTGSGNAHAVVTYLRAAGGR